MQVINGQIAMYQNSMKAHTFFLSFFFPLTAKSLLTSCLWVKENNTFKGDQIWSHEVAIFCLGVVQTTERWEGRAWKGGVVGRERPTLRVGSEKKVAPVLRAQRTESRGSGGGGGGRRRRGGAESGPGRRSGSRPGAQLRPTSPGPRPAASAARQPAQRGLVPAPKLSLGKANGGRATRTQAPPDRRGGRASVPPCSAEPGGRLTAARPPASEGRCPGRGRGHRPASLPRLNPKGWQTINKSKSLGRLLRRGLRERAVGAGIPVLPHRGFRMPAACGVCGGHRRRPPPRAPRNYRSRPPGCRNAESRFQRVMVCNPLEHVRSVRKHRRSAVQRPDIN